MNFNIKNAEKSTLFRASIRNPNFLNFSAILARCWCPKPTKIRKKLKKKSHISQKILKKVQYLAFTDKVKIINTYVPEKVKIYIEKNLLDELKYFQKKYSYEVKIFSDDKFIIPEYKIDLLNKSKKLINSFENINLVIANKKITKKSMKEKKDTARIKDKTKKTKSKKKVRTLWVRRKKKN